MNLRGLVSVTGKPGLFKLIGQNKGGFILETLDKAKIKSVVNLSTTKMATLEDITIYGEGSQTRSFCYVDDLIEGMLRLMDSPADLTGPINIGNPSEYTMLELAETVLRLVGGASKIEFRPLPSDDPRQRQPDISLAKADLGWEPKIGLEDGLKETIAYFRHRLQA